MLITNIKTLVLGQDKSEGFAQGEEMRQLPTLENAFLLIHEGKIASFGPMEECPEGNFEVYDASGRMVLPAWCDSHTHLVFAGPRDEEFVDKIKGSTYEEIARKGGGILNSALKLGKMSEQELYEKSMARLSEVVGQGTGAIEIKSGYGLSLESELKILRVIQRIKETSPVSIKATFLGAHAIPLDYKENRQGYIELIINEMIPAIGAERLADYIDVFCEKIAFSVEETDQILNAGARYGLRPKIHTNQFNSMGGIEVALKHNALSVDHLEVLSDQEIDILKGKATISTLLPSAPFFINDPFPPARKMIDIGLGVALATDFNPGSSPSGKMPFVLSLACIKMKMLPEEAINAATINGAYAMGLSKELGSISVGKKANFIITKPIPSLAYIMYSFGSDHVEKVVIGGEFA